MLLVHGPPGGVVGDTVGAMAISPPALALLDRDDPWPLAGHVRGALQGPSASVAWVGRVKAAAGPQSAWRASRRLEDALTRAGAPSGDRRRVLSVLWSRLEGLAEADDLVLLLAARDEAGVALSAVGVQRLYGARDGVLQTWLASPHPLLGAPGVPARMPGALVLPDLPSWVVGAADDSALDGAPLQDVFVRCGVHG